MKVEYDAQAQAVYIYIRDEPVHHTRVITDDCNIDFTSLGDIVGIEILNIDGLQSEEL